MRGEWELILSGGAAREILDAGGSIAPLLRSGRRRSPAFQLYLDLGRKEPQALASILIEASGDENYLHASRYGSRSVVKVRLLIGLRPSVDGV